MLGIGNLLFHLSLPMFLYYLGKMNPRNWVSSVMLNTENETAFACCIFDNHEPILIIFGSI